MFVTQLHNSLATSLILFMLVCGVWGFVSAFRGGMSGSFTGALFIGEGLIIVQGLLGVASYLLGFAPAQGLHFLYGLTAAITFPGVYSFARGRSSESQALWYGAGALFIVGLAIRGIITGRGSV